RCQSPFLCHHKACTARLNSGGGAAPSSDRLKPSKSICFLLTTNGGDSIGLCDPAVQPIAQPIPAAERRQEPWVAGIERVVGEVLAVEGAGIVRGAGELARGLPAEIAHHRDAAAVAAERVM